MKKILYICLGVFALTAAGAVSAPELQAQDCWECSWEVNPNVHTWATDSQGCDFEGCRDKPSNELEDPNYYPGDCTPYTPCWTSEAFDFDGLVNAVDSERVDLLFANLTEYSDGVHFNQERQAIQVLGCSGDVIAHLPLSAGLATALQQELEL